MMNWSSSVIERTAAALPGVIPDMLHGEFEQLMLDFLRRSRAWRIELDGLSTINKVLDLAAAVEYAKVVAAIGPIGNGSRSIPPAAGAGKRIFGPRLSAGDSPFHYYTVPPSFTKIHFMPELSTELSELTAEVYLVHVPNGLSQVPEDLCLHYEEPLVAGLTGRLQLKPNKPYTDVRQGAANMAEYQMGVREAHRTANKGRTTTPAPWLFPGWA